MSGRDSTVGDGRRRLGGGWRDKKCQGETPPSVMAEEGLVVDGEKYDIKHGKDGDEDDRVDIELKKGILI